MSILTDTKNQDVRDTSFLGCDYIKRLPEVIGNIMAAHHRADLITRMIRNTVPDGIKKD